MDSRAETWLVLPLNVAAVMPEELQPESEVVWVELELYLRDRGKELKTLARPTARALWLKSIREVRAGEAGRRADYEDASRALVLELQKHAEFDAMVVPSLFVRKAVLQERVARWDGVERALEFESRGGATLEDDETGVEGTAAAASLHVVVFDAHGRKLHEGVGGLEPLVRVRVLGEDSFGKPAYSFAARETVFSDTAHLREGFVAAFGRFLPPDER